MKLFRKKKNRLDANPRTEVLARRIAGRIVWVQSRIAKCLNERTRHLTRRQKLVWLILFSLLFGAVNLWLLIGSITNK